MTDEQKAMSILQALLAAQQLAPKSRRKFLALLGYEEVS